VESAQPFPRNATKPSFQVSPQIGSNPARIAIAKFLFMVEYMNFTFVRTRILHRPEWKQNMHDWAHKVK